MGVPSSIISPWESASGGVGYEVDEAKLAAIGESIERYAATIKQLPLKSKTTIQPDSRIDPEKWCLFSRQQREDPSFPFGNLYKDTCLYTNIFRLADNKEYWVPHPLVALRDDFQTGAPTSSGLAAGPTHIIALLRAIQELIERDALMITWMHSVPARSIKVPTDKAEQVKTLNGEVWAFDLTPEYSPFPVIAVAGGIPKQGRWRYSLGVACRETASAALDKAFLEWNQGVLFAGIYEKHADTSSLATPDNVNNFDDHAIYYTVHPEEWHNLPMFRNRNIILPVTRDGKQVAPSAALETVMRQLAKKGIGLYYRDMSTIDCHQLGIRVVRAVSPDMASIFAHQNWPLIGNIEDKLASRYPWASEGIVFPNKLPHPLG